MKELIERIQSQKDKLESYTEDYPSDRHIFGRIAGLGEAISLIESHDPWHRWPAEKPILGRLYITQDCNCERPDILASLNYKNDPWTDLDCRKVIVTHYHELPVPPKDTE